MPELLPLPLPDEPSQRSPIATLLGAIAFYTCLPLPRQWRLEFWGIARWVTLVGLGIGSVLAGFDWGLSMLGTPIFTRSALVIVAWVAITGGLHLDGAMDTADGLAVIDPQRRLAVMADSHTGAFGVMAAGAILLLKLAALTDLGTNRWFVLMGVAGWGRWGQLVAIARDPYLKVEGKGALHKVAIQSLWDVVPSLLLLLGFSGLGLILHPERWLTSVAIALAGCSIALLVGAYFKSKLGGHTCDTYGAIVEWTEALLLCVLTSVS